MICRSAYGKVRSCNYKIWIEDVYNFEVCQPRCEQ